MMSYTHATLSIAATSLVLNTANPALLIMTAFVSQLPDIDTSSSRIGRLLSPISKRLEERFIHRTVTHSFLATGAFALLTMPIAFWVNKCWLAMLLGYFCGWFGDAFTKKGVAAFYPNAARLIIPANPRLRLSTGSNAEFFVLALLVAVAIVSIYINGSGGILRSFNQFLGIPSGAVEIASAEASQYLLITTVNGRKAITQEPVNAQFEVIRPLTQNDILVKDKQGSLYRVGTSTECQIVANRITIQRGQKIRSQVLDIQLQNESIGSAIAKLSLKLERTYINGTLLLENAEDLMIPTQADKFNTITLQPGREFAIVRLESASPALVTNLLGDYDATGNLIIRTVEVL